ncbi:MAG: hypothetical protein GWP05_05235 [Anaerolineaceae bacterium]|nr:hypothetical protein [Anaerolineaceae bacterium]
MASVLKRRFRWGSLGLAARFVLFAALYYLFMSLWVDPRIIYDRYIPVSQNFSRTLAHLVAMLHVPGGAVGYAAGYLHQYYCYNWLGSLIIAAVALLISVAVDRLLPIRTGSWFRLVSFIPALVLLVPYCRYQDYLQTSLEVLVALAVANLYVRIAPGSFVRRVILMLVLAAVVYYLAGAYLLFNPPVSGNPLIGVKESYQMAYFRHNKMWGEFLELARQVQPQDFVRLPLENKLRLNHDINRALYHEGKLLDEMFHSPQDAGALFLFNRKRKKRDLSRWESERVASLFFEIGRVNAAERMAHELLQRFGDRPSTLRLLAEINIVKEQTPAARVFLGYLAGLRNDPRYERWAEQMLSSFETTGALPVDERLLRIRSWNVRRGSLNSERTIVGDMMELLESNPKNRMAFEYLMANCLLTNNLQGVANNIGRLKKLGYQRMPRHIQEAILLYDFFAGRKVDLHGYRIEAKVRRQFATVIRTMQYLKKAGRRPKEFLLFLGREPYRDSYFFHFFSTWRPAAGAKKK